MGGGLSCARLRVERKADPRDQASAVAREQLEAAAMRLHHALDDGGPRPAPPLSLRATSRRVNGCFKRSTSAAGMPGPRSTTSSTAAPFSARTATLTSFPP